jgi:hypothetical protein
LFVPEGGDGLNVRVVPMTEYRLGFCTTPLMATMMEVGPAGAYVSVKAVVVPLPENWSNGNAAVVGSAPM